MNDAALKAALEREERAYEDLVQVLASLGTMLAESIRKDRDLSEFVQHKRDLLLLTRSADIRRTELKAELLGRQLKKAEEEQRQAIEAAKAAKRTAAALEEARRSYARAANVERRWGLETRRLEELRLEEMGRLERLRSEELPGDSQTAAEGSDTAELRSGTWGPQEGAERPWWRRVFGG